MMRRFLISIIFLLICSVAYGQVTSNVLLRVLRFQSGDKSGTAFTVEVDGQQYLITARHNLVKPDTKVDIKLFLNGAWRSFKARAIYPDNDSVDIVALDVGQKVTIDFSFEPTSHDIIIGQQVYFVGYPWGLGSRGRLPGSIAEIPFVKSGVLSAIDGRQTDAVIFYVDGDNNPGFSGAPIVYRHSKTGAYRVAAVVRGYRSEAFPVLKKKDLQNLGAKAYEDLYTRGNSGIIVAYKIKHIVDAIQKYATPR
jgi:hypothetical protein